jgi:ubiquinone/menaquinone biosynthesis C-methylase UbiE
MQDAQANNRRRDVWDEAAADYEAFAEPFTRQFAEAALQLAGGVRPGERVLDVAAGTGALTLSVARDGAQVLATDFSPGMVALLSQRLVTAGLGHQASAQVMDGQALTLADASFDAAFSIFGIMLFPDWERGLAELARVVRPGGRGVVAVWASDEGAGPAPVLAAAQRIAFPDRPLPLPAPGMVRLKDPTALQIEMEQAGFREIVVTQVSGSWTAPSANWVADNADRLFRQMPLWATLAGDDRERLRTAFRHRLRTVGGEGELRLNSDAYIAVGRR